MKGRLFLRLLASFFAGGLFVLVSYPVGGQSAVYFSNLAEAGGGGLALDNQHWYAQELITGTASQGYSLDSVQFSAAAVGTPGGNFSVFLYAGLNAPPISVLNGPNPSAPGTYTFMATGVTLLPSRHYWVAATSTGTSDANNYFFWNESSTMNFNSSDGWSLPAGNNLISSGDGIHWFHDFSVVPPFLLAVNATAVPEPRADMLTGLGLALACLRRKK